MAERLPPLKSCPCAVLGGPWSTDSPGKFVSSEGKCGAQTQRTKKRREKLAPRFVTNNRVLCGMQREQLAEIAQ